MEQVMDNQINVGHPFYFPTQVVLVDDDPDFLDGINLMLDKNLSCRLFQSATDALAYVNTSHRHVQILERCYNHYKTGPLDSDSLSHVDIGKLHEEIFNGNRFQTSSTVVVDYSMPEMNGLDFLMELKNPFIKKILLTGQADTELAVKAFNRQLIDQFIDKHDPALRNILNSAISSFQQQYFRSSFKLVTDPIIASNHDSYLTDANFQEYLEQVRESTGAVEYYMIDSPHSGYMLVDSAVNRHSLLIFDDTAMEDHCEQLIAMRASETLISRIRNRELIPAFDSHDDALHRDHPHIAQWSDHYHPATKLTSHKNYFTSLLSGNDLPMRYSGQIIPYGDFLQGTALDREILH